MNILEKAFSKDRLHNIENIATQIIYYALPVIVIITLIAAGFSKSNSGLVWQRRWAENWVNLLIIILMIKPIMVLTKRYFQPKTLTISSFVEEIKVIKPSIQSIKNIIIDLAYSISTYLMRFRRQLGLLTFRLLFTHGLLLQISRIKMWLPLFFNIKEALIYTGVIGLVALLIGAITSNDYSIKLLKKNRKRVQMIAYLAFIFSLVHVILAGQTSYLLRLIIYPILKFLELKPQKA